MSNLILYSEACKALAQCKATDEVKDIRDKAEAMRAYARQAKNKQLETDAAEIRFRAERRIGELMQLQRETEGLNRGTAGKGRPSLGGLPSNPPKDDKPTLAEAGIDKNLANRARKIAAIPQDKFEGMVGEWRGRVEKETERVTVNLLREGEKHNHRALGSGENEWYTPSKYLDFAREAMGGIDLDPASSAIAQRVVKASEYFDENADGLSRSWHGRVWLNPPYSRDLIGKFIDHLIKEYEDGRVSQAILLTHNYTDTRWFHAAESASKSLCFTRGRIAFVDQDGVPSSPTQGQTFFYLGSDAERFASAFSEVGFVR